MKKAIMYFVTWFWYITMQQAVNKTVPALRNVFLANNGANRAFVRRFQGTERYKDINFVLCKITYFGRNRVGAMIIMMGLPSTGHVITARLNLGKTAHDITAQARNIKSKITGNSNVTFSPGEIAALGTEINTYEDAHGAAKDLAYDAMNKTLKSYLVRIQAAADANTSGEQIVIIQSTGCIVQGVGGRSEQVFDGFQGIASGSIVLTGPAASGHAFHEWWYSANGTVWERIQGTVEANTLVTGLIAGQNAWFRHQIINSEGGTGMSQPIKLMVS
ncbi:MAG: hypothetical protein WCL14_01095 [Bacteroidota bacterium]